MDEKGKRLLQAINENSEYAFNEFYRMYAPFVLKIAKQLVSDPLEAEDICHDIFLEVFEKPEEYDDAKGTVKAWLAVKTKHRSIDRLRKKKPVLVRKLEQLDTKEAVKTELEVLKSLEKNVLLEALAHLPEKQREVIYGAYFENKTQTELARTLNKPLGTIKSNVRYGLNNLRKYKKLRQWFA